MRRWQWALSLTILALVVWVTRSWWDAPRAPAPVAQVELLGTADHDESRPIEPVNPAGDVSAESPAEPIVVDSTVVPASANLPIDEGSAVTAQDNTAIPQPPADVASDLPHEQSTSASTSSEIDLLSRIDLERDVIKGDWQFDSGQLSSPPDVNQARVQVPVEPPDEYTLRMVIMRGGHGKYTTFGIGLVAAGRQFYVLLDSNEVGGSLGLDLLDGKSWNQNSSTKRTRVLADGVPAEVVCTVRKDGLRVLVDGNEALTWSGDYRRLSLYPAWTVPNKRQLFLGTDCNYVVSKLTLAPLAEPTPGHSNP